MPQQVPRRDQEIKATVAALALLLVCSRGASAADAVARGAYLAGAAGCDQCHSDTEHGGQPYAGAPPYPSPYGPIATPNLTPDRATGIGGWSLADFIRAVRWGVAPDDSHYVPSFPYPSYNRLTDADLADLKAYLDSLPPVARHDLAGAGLTALVARARAALAVALMSLPGAWQPNPAKDPVWNRGAYLVASVGRCGECHTPRNWLGVPDSERFLAGSPVGPDGKKVPNITQDTNSGIGNWSEQDIVGVLTDGHTPDFDFVAGPMADIVKNTARLTEADRRAIAVFLRSVPSKPFAAKE